MRHKADIECCNFVQHEIELEDSPLPHKEGAIRRTSNKLDPCRKEIVTLVGCDMIETSKSPWEYGVKMIKKKGDQLMFYFDFRYLNSVTVKDTYPIPRIDESLSKLGDAKFLTTLDLGSAFSQVSLRKQDREKTGVCMRAGIISMKEDALWPLQCDSHLPPTNGRSADKRNQKKIKHFTNVLRR